MSNIINLQYDVDEYYDTLEQEDEYTPPEDEICIYNIPQGTEYINCSNQFLTCISEVVLPKSLKYFDCSNNLLSQLPLLSLNLIILNCANNNLICISNIILPDSLTDFDCSNNKISELPLLPPNLLYLNCDNNDIEILPSVLPKMLKMLSCKNNNISVLPSLPLGLCSWSNFDGNPLEKNYPKIYTFINSDNCLWKLKLVRLINYVHQCNVSRRVAECINPDNILWKIYIERRLHPRFLEPLKNDENIDIDDFIRRYLDTL